MTTKVKVTTKELNYYPIERICEGYSTIYVDTTSTDDQVTTIIGYYSPEMLTNLAYMLRLLQKNGIQVEFGAA